MTAVVLWSVCPPSVAVVWACPHRFEIENRKSRIEQGADWCPVQTCPLSLGSEKHDLRTVYTTDINTST